MKNTLNEKNRLDILEDPWKYTAFGSMQYDTQREKRGIKKRIEP